MEGMSQVCGSYSSWFMEYVVVRHCYYYAEYQVLVWLLYAIPLPKPLGLHLGSLIPS